MDKIFQFMFSFLSSLISPTITILIRFWEGCTKYKNESNHLCWWDTLADILGIISGILVKYFILN